MKQGNLCDRKENNSIGKDNVEYWKPNQLERKGVNWNGSFYDAIQCPVENAEDRMT